MNYLNIFPTDLIQEIIIYLDIDSLNNFIKFKPSILKSINWNMSLKKIEYNFSISSNLRICENLIDYKSYQLIFLLINLINKINNSAHKATNYIRFTLPYDIKSIYNLTELDLDYLQLGILPDEICNLVNLKCLILANNKLSSLPKKFYKLKQLQELYIDINNFYKIPKVIFRLSKLVALYGANNFIDRIPDEISELKKLEELYLSSNPIKDCSLEIFNMKKLIFFSLDYKNIEENFKLSIINHIFENRSNL